MPTPIASLGEFGLIKHLTDQASSFDRSHVHTSIGDDCAVLAYNEDKDLLVTTDMLLEGVHFDLTYTPMKHLGYKSVVVNVSDICAMNGTPRSITIGLGISSKFSVELLEDFYEGVYAACKQYNVSLVGGDTCASRNGLTISITCLGDVDRGKAILRSTARPNDIICVTGNLGAAFMGFKLLEREKKIFESNPSQEFTPDFSGYEYLIERQLKPEAQNHLQELLSTIGVTPTSMIDVSDGLSSELLHLSDKSGVGVKVFEDKIPIDYQTISLCETLDMNPITVAFNGGEDYEILFTVSLTDIDKVQNIEGISIIGHTTPEPTERLLIAKDDTGITLQAQGWNATEHLD